MAPVYRTVAAYAGGSIYVLGGIDPAGATTNTVEQVNPATGAAVPAGSLALPTHGASALTIGGKVFVFGGASSTVHQTVQAYDPATGTTSVAGQLPGPRADLAAATAANDVVLLGGFDGTGPLASVLSSPNGTAFGALASLPQAVRYPAVAALGDSVYLFGGLLSGGEYTGTFTNDIQKVDVTTGATAIVGHLPVAIAHAKAAVINGQVVVVGGSAASGPSGAIYRLDPASGTVYEIGNLPEPRTDGALVVAGGTAYWLGGLSTVPVSTVMAIRLVSP